MPNISQADYLRLKNCYRRDVAVYLAKAASGGSLVTYGKLADEFGGTARGYGDVLCGIAIRCHEAGLPLLSVIVVNQETRLPSVDALIYRDLGLDDAAVLVEQERCFKHDWGSLGLIAS